MLLFNRIVSILVGGEKRRSQRGTFVESVKGKCCCCFLEAGGVWWWGRREVFLIFLIFF